MSHILYILYYSHHITMALCGLDKTLRIGRSPRGMRAIAIRLKIGVDLEVEVHTGVCKEGGVPTSLRTALKIISNSSSRPLRQRKIGELTQAVSEW